MVIDSKKESSDRKWKHWELNFIISPSNQRNQNYFRSFRLQIVVIYTFRKSRKLVFGQHWFFSIIISIIYELISRTTYIQENLVRETNKATQRLYITNYIECTSQQVWIKNPATKILSIAGKIPQCLYYGEPVLSSSTSFHSPSKWNNRDVIPLAPGNMAHNVSLGIFNFLLAESAI